MESGFRILNFPAILQTEGPPLDAIPGEFREAFSMSSTWDAGLYDAKHTFVWDKAKGLVDLLAARVSERILDLGCGTGALTAELAASGAELLGVDRSPEMIPKRAKVPHLRFEVCDARRNSRMSSTQCFPMPLCTGFGSRTCHSGHSAGAKARRKIRGGIWRQGNVRNVVTAIETVFADLGISATAPIRGSIRASRSTRRYLKNTTWKCAKQRCSNGRQNWKMASTVWKCGSRCSPEHFWIVCHPTGEVSFCAQWSKPRALPSGRPITGNSITADSASPPRKPHRSTRKD